MWTLIWIIGFILCLGSIVIHETTVKDTIRLICFIPFTIGLVFMIISIIIDNPNSFNTKEYKYSIKIKTTILNDSIIKCDTFYVITPK